MPEVKQQRRIGATSAVIAARLPVERAHYRRLSGAVLDSAIAVSVGAAEAGID
jgi:hypothetical protein